MYPRSILTRILWLSDIHIWKEYQTMNAFNKDIDNYFAAFFEEIKDEQLDYILLSGDIAYTGRTPDYEYFEQLFFKKLSAKHSEACLLVVPGNHDINHLDSKNLMKTVDGVNGRNTYTKRNSDYLVLSNKKKFQKNFKEYSKFFNSSSISNLFPEDINDTYRKHKLYGYHINKSKKLIFVLVNTAWFSLGSNFSDLMQVSFMNDPQISGKRKSKSTTLKKEILATKITTLLRTKDNISEYGSQLIGSKLWGELELMKNVLHQYPDFTVLTVMHHPPNWLHWLERYDNDEKKQELKMLHTILDCSNFLLTGHEHVPHIKNKETYDETYHLKTGCFLDELNKKTKFLDLKHNRFSILEINNGNNNWMVEKIYQYDPDVKRHLLVHKWKKLSVKKPIFYNFKYAETPNNSLDRNFKLSSHLQKISSVSGIENLRETLDYSLQRIGTIIYIISKEVKGVQEIVKIPFVKSILNEFQNNNQITVHFLLKDTHCKIDIYATLSDCDFPEIREKRAGLFNNFYNEYNLKFDVFRNTLFKNLEEDPQYELARIMDINIICEILPYWYYESQCR